MAATADFLFAGTKFSVSLLKAVAGAIPVPFVQLAVTSACALIDIVEGIRSNKDRRNELNTRICALMLVMIAPLRGKKEEEIPLDLKADIEQLTSDLQDITDEFRKLARQHRVSQIFFKDDNAETIQRCLNRLNGSMDKFNVSRKINEAVRLCDISGKVDELYKGMKKRAQSASILPSFVMPSKPIIFYGRGQAVKDIVDLLSTANSPRVAILGPGGMGKTSLALAVVEHPTVVEIFGENRFWVPCIEASSPSWFLDVLAASLQIAQATNDCLADIISELKASSDRRRLILLDNFETPWNLDGCRPKIEHILCALAQLPHVTLLITMRSNRPPSQRIQWATLPWSILPALEKHAAHQVYLDIHPEARHDSALGPLLHSVGYMPLAIMLMAKVGSNSGDMPTELQKEWNDPRIRTNLLTDGSDSENNINISIQLSVNSRYVQADQKAITLLSILSMLPGGARREFIPQLAPSIPNISGALSILSQASLVEQRPVRSIHVQPVIGSYMLLHHPLSALILQDVYRAFYNLLASHKSEPGDPHFNDDVRALVDEEVNIQAILMEAAESGCGTDTLDALLTFSWYQHWTRPKAEMVQFTVKAAKEAKNERYIAEALRCQGYLFHELDRYPEASVSLKEARESFQLLHEPLSAARCLLKLSEVYACTSDLQDRYETAKEAEIEFRTLGDRHGVAGSLLQLGAFYYTQLRWREAYVTLGEARREFLDLGDPLGAAHCLRYISRTHLSTENYDAAEEAAWEARQEYQRLPYPFGATRCLITLGASQLINSCYDQALETFREGLVESRQLGSPLLIAQCLNSLGYLYQRQLLYEEACRTYEESRGHYQRVSSSQSRRGAAQCLEQLGNIYLLQSRYEEASEALEKARNEYDAIGSYWLSSRCSRRLDQARAGPKSIEDLEGDSTEMIPPIFSVFMPNEILGLDCCQYTSVV